jgi:hypothetical protein
LVESLYRPADELSWSDVLSIVRSFLVALVGLVGVNAYGFQLRAAPNDIRSTRILAMFPANTFLENIVAMPNGDLYVDSYPDGIVYRVKPDGTYAVFCRTGGKIAGIQAGPNNGFVVAGWSAEGKACVFEIASDGTVTKQVVLDGRMFPNGVERVGRNRYLNADSYAGLIWDFD